MPRNENKKIVLKFGSSCIKEPACFHDVASLIIERLDHYTHIVVVVSAMGDFTDQLISLAKSVHPSPPKREYDMMVSVGERISIALLAMALHKRGEEAISFTGSQSGIITSNDHSNAEIIAVRPQRILEAFTKYRVVIVAGFQGVSEMKEITTLGRGGSDTTAVALAAALQAEKVEFFKDVGGIADKDPKIYKDAHFYDTLSYKEALKLAQGKRRPILHPRALLLADKEQIPLEIKSIISSERATYVGKVHKRALSPY